MYDREKSCEEVINEMWEDTRRDIEGILESNDMIEQLNNICIAYTEFHNEVDEELYHKLEFSWGGPADFINIYVYEDNTFKRAEYHFQDWFDGAKKELEGYDKRLVEELYVKCLRI